MGNNRDIVVIAGAKVLEHAGSHHEVVDRRLWSRASKISVAVLDVIEDAEKKQVKHLQVKPWFQGIKDLCYELIDVSEEFELVQKPKKLRILGFLRESVRQWFNGNPEVESIIGEFEDLINEISKLHLRSSSDPVPDEAEQLGSSSDPVPDDAELDPLYLHSLAVPSNIIGGELMIGQDAEIQDLIRKLTKEYHRCICLVRKDVGIGTTALARNVYNSPQVQSKFHFRAWVTVSQQLNVKRIVKTLLESAPEKPEYDGDEFELLKLELRQFIARRELLLVLEDVSNLDSNHFSDLMNVLSDSLYRILITTRKEEVAKVAKEVEESTHTVFMKGLSPEACWSIIKHHAFGDDLKDESSVERMFGQDGRKIAEKCKGEPLVAKSFGVMLRGRSPGEWRRVLMHEKLLGYDLTSVPMLSEHLYSRMPPALRQCLLYCSIFPKNHSFQVDKLVKLWMAQGFIASYEEDKMEIQGLKYVKQLRDCSAFQEFELDGEGALVCKLQEEMHEFIQDLAQNECRILFDEGTTMEESGDNHRAKKPPHCRHCTLCLEEQTSFTDSIDNGGKLKVDKLHTLMVLSKSSDIDPPNLASLLCCMKRIRALDLRSCAIEELPLKPAELLHIRYLNLSLNRELRKLPSAISNLINLQTLNLNGCDNLQKLPKSIGKLIKLRHLEILLTKCLSYLPKGIASLTLLRTLNRFFGSSGGASRSKSCSLGDLENLNNIEGYLTIDGLGGETEIYEAERAGLKNKKNLLHLELGFSIVGLKDNDQVLLDSLEAPPQLQSLGIFDYRGSSFPKWMMELNKLTQLMLDNCSECNDLPPLGKLQSLESLEIKNMPNVIMVGLEFLGIGLNHEDAGNEGSSSYAVAFPSLRKLHFENLDEWKWWIENGNGGDTKIMPLLSSLSVVNCEKLESLPDYIKMKENLKPVIRGCPLLPEN